MKRVCVLGVVLIAILLVIVNLSAPKIVAYDTYVVHQGDTLWGIAEQSNGYGRIDAYAIINDIKEASDITDDISIGDVIQVPMYE